MFITMWTEIDITFNFFAENVKSASVDIGLKVPVGDSRTTPYD